MTHGTPDWGVTAGAVTTYQLTELGELAVRLGSIVTHDRRGDVIFLEDFESGLHRWHPLLTADGAAADLSMARSRSGLFSARLVAGSAGEKYAQIRYEGPFPALSLCGLEFSFLSPGTSVRLRGVLGIDDGTTDYSIGARWNGPTERVDIWTPSGWVAVGSAAPLNLFQTRIFNTLKVVGDPATGDYVRVVFNEQAVDISAYSLYSADSHLSPHLGVAIDLTDTLATNPVAYVDDVIVTQNEPAQP